MKIVFYNLEDIIDSEIMDLDINPPHRGDMHHALKSLFSKLREQNHAVGLIEKETDILSFDAVLFFDFPTLKNKYFKSLLKLKFENIYLIIYECEVINKLNWDIKNHKYFKKIFTWSDDFVDNKKYFKINWSFHIPKEINFNLNKKDKFCTMIVANKYKKHPLEIYSERVEAINWFEQHHPSEFDLYGVGWDKYLCRGVLSELNYFKFLRKFFKKNLKTYKGEVKSKKDILEKYKFSFCYENAKNINGYITEKIFDCFFAGCIPIYLGTSNINKHIPKNTFIDKRNFKTYEELYKYLKKMDVIEYNNYLNNIKKYLLSDKIYQFSSEYFAETIIKEIISIK